MENMTDPTNIPEEERETVPFTPGPWTVHGLSVRGSRKSVLAKDPYLNRVAGCPCWTNGDPSPDDAAANARLIAAAPDLYRECKQGALTLDEAANVFEGNGLPGMASLLRIQAQVQRDVLKQALGTASPSYGRVEQPQASGGNK